MILVVPRYLIINIQARPVSVPNLDPRETPMMRHWYDTGIGVLVEIGKKTRDTRHTETRAVAAHFLPWTGVLSLRASSAAQTTAGSLCYSCLHEYSSTALVSIPLLPPTVQLTVVNAAAYCTGTAAATAGCRQYLTLNSLPSERHT